MRFPDCDGVSLTRIFSGLLTYQSTHLFAKSDSTVDFSDKTTY